MKIIVFFIYLVSYSHATSAEVLNWTSKGGYSFEGRFVSQDANIVTLKGTDGKTVQVPINVLDEKSRLQLKQEASEFAENAPVFTYQNTFYRYAIYPRRDWVHLTFLEGGEPLNPEPYVLNVNLSEKMGRDWKSYKITGLAEDPVKSSSEVEVNFTTDKGVILQLITSTTNTKDFSFQFKIEGTSREFANLNVRNTLSFDALLEYDMESKKYKGPFSESGYTFQELPGALEGYNITYEKNKDSITIGYHEKQKGSNSGEEIVIQHPNYPELTLDRGDSPGSMNIWFYGGKAPMGGYSVRFDDSKDSHEAGPFSISVGP